MRNILIGLAVLIIVVIGVLILAPSFIPADLYKPQVAKAVDQATGRKVDFSDDVHLSLFPRTEITLKDVVVSNPPAHEGEGKAPYFASIKQLDVGVGLISLLSGDVRVERFILTNPEIYIQSYKDGSSNLAFGGQAGAPQEAEAPETGKPAPGSKPAPAPGGQAGAGIQNLRLGDIRIDNGTVTVFDPAGQKETYKDINVKLSLEDLDAPFTADGSVTYRGKPASLSIRIGRARALMDGSQTQASLSVDSPLAKAGFDGTIALPEAGANLAGKLKADVPSVRKLAAYLGNPIGGNTGFGALNLESDVNAKGDKIALSGVTLSFDGMKATGKLGLNLAGAKPLVTGNLSVDQLDFNKFMTGTSATGKGGPTDAPITLAQAESWSNDPIDFSALKSFNANLKLAADKVYFQDIKVGKSDVGVKVTEDVLNASLSKSELYSGTGSSTVTVDARKPASAIAMTFTVSSVQLLPFLKDAVSFDRIEGLGDITLSLTTQGRSQRQFVRNLGGNGSFKALNGAWRGVNLAEMARSIDKVVGLGLNKDQTAGQENVGEGNKTDFAELSGTFTIAKGIVSNKDLQLLNPFVRVSGDGTVNLVQQTINYTVLPKLVGTIQGQGGQFKKSGVTVPILVSGPLSQPSYKPDFQRLLKDQLIGTPGDNQAPLNKLLDKALGTDKKQQPAPSDGTNQPADNKPAPTQEQPNPLNNLLKQLQQPKQEGQ